ncbi:MAG: SDR family oxidoreductase [Anaerolineae bacterium]
MKALVIGASGQVGGALLAALCERGHSVVGTYRQHAQPGLIALNTADATVVAQVLDYQQPDWVFYPAGLSWVDLCEREPERCYRENVTLPMMVAQQAARLGAGFVYYSTEYVFDGEAGPYTEQAEPRPISAYGRSKLAAEQQLSAAFARLLIVRTTVVYGPEAQHKNFVYQLVAKLGQGETMFVPNDQISTPTYNVDLAAASVECVERDVTGVVNLVGPDRLDRAEFAQVVCRVFDLDNRLIVPRATAELGQLASRPLQAGLVNTFIQSRMTTRMRGVQAGLIAMRSADGL